jgi:voltage-gated potassium channel
VATSISTAEEAPVKRRRRPYADPALVGLIRMPDRQISPVRALVGRVLVAAGALLATASIVYFGRDGYLDGNSDSPISFGDAIYYATVSLSTTGYGDIVPVTDTARLWTTLAITPLRLLFLIVLVGTTVELLTERSRQAFRIDRWRRHAHDHVVVIGYGTKGRAAVQTLRGHGPGSRPSPGAGPDVVVVDTDRDRLDAATAHGLVAVHGDATRSGVLQLAGVPRAAGVVVATNRDDTAVLVTLTARQLAPSVRIVVAVREAENVRLLRQSGANSVVVSAETAGRLLGMATRTPAVVDAVEDLLTPRAGPGVGERVVADSEVGSSPQQLGDVVLAVIRSGELHHCNAPAVQRLQPGDRLVHLRNTNQSLAGTPDNDGQEPQWRA